MTEMTNNDRAAPLPTLCDAFLHGDSGRAHALLDTGIDPLRGEHRAAPGRRRLLARWPHRQHRQQRRE